MRPNTCFSRTTYSLNRYNVKGELDCFNCKTRGGFSDYPRQCLQKKAIRILVFAEKSTRLWEYLTIIKKLKIKCSLGTHCCINCVLSNSTNNASIQLNIVNCKIYPSELLSVQDHASIVSKHNTEIVTHLQIVKYNFVKKIPLARALN